MSYDIGKNLVISGSTTVLTRRFKTVYRKLDSDKSTVIKNGTNYYENLNLPFLEIATNPHGPTDTDDIINVPANYLFVGIISTSSLQTNQTSSVTQKQKYVFPVTHGRDYLSSSLSYGEVLKSNIALPVNFISGNITDGYQSEVSNRFMSGVIITNIHNDAYGSDKEVGLQGPFAEQWVGGRQSRHVSINRGTDSYITRPEAWKLVLGQLGTSSYQATLGFVGSDYPYPEGNDYEPSFPVVAHKRATYYREEFAKRPVNIKNIKYSTGSYEIGNYSNNYEVVSIFDRTSNNRLLRKTLLDNQSNIGIVTELSGVLRTTTSGRVDFELVDRVSGSSKSVIGNRFAAPGGARYTSRGFLNRYAEELSPYNAITYRNREVIGNSFGSGMPYSVSAVSGASGTGSMYALSLRSDFGGYAAGTSIPSLHKVNKNTIYASKDGVVGLVGKYDNFYISHQIPNKDHGYAWIRSSLPYIIPTASVWEFYSHANLAFTSSNTIASSILGIKVNGSQVTGGVEQPTIVQDFVGLNTMIVEPINISSNLVGTSSILTITSSYLTSFATASNLFNSMLIHRNGGYGLPTFKQLSHHRNDKLAQYYRSNNIIQNVNSTGVIQNYTEPVYESSNFPIIVEAVQSSAQITTNTNVENVDYVDVYFTYDNFATKFSNPDLMRDLQLSLEPNKEREQILKQATISHTSSNPYYYEPIKITYNRTIFPFSNISRRKRTSFVYSKWKDTHANRITTNYIVNSSYTLNSASIWPLDGRINYSTTSASFSQTFLDQSTEGLLQNLYALRYTGSGSPASLPIYYYKQSLRSVDSTKSPSGVSNGFLPLPIAISESVLFANSTKWQVYDDFGYKPFYNSYEEWIGEAHKQFKNYAVLPEYIISNKIENYLENDFSTRTLFENYLEVTGASIYALTSSNDLSTAAYIEKIVDTNYNSGSEITIQITCNTLEKFIPYNGFYPVERTVELVNAFSSSYSNYVSLVEGTSSVSFGTPTFAKNYRTLISPLFAPGILYNTIKSGLAVDYPVITGSLLTASTVYDTNSAGTSSYQIANNRFDLRLPFETILEPESYLNGARFVDMNPHPEVRLSNSTASLYAPSSINSYKLMINNFLAETTNLFLKNSTPSYIRSKQVSEVRAESGKRYQALLKVYKTTTNSTKNLGTQTLYVDDYPRPQYSSSAQENITMFSNPLGFGPPCGSGTGSQTLGGGGSTTIGTKDSSNGFNSPFTPPYYDGESWAIIEFVPSTTKTYSLDEIIGSSSVNYIRYEFDQTADYTQTVGNSGPQGSSYMNANAMQVSASLNIFNLIEAKELQPEISSIGARLSSTAQTSNKKIWEISSKFETPILNFHPLYTGKTVTQSTGSEYGLANAGMWLQYGVIPENDQGIFMQITDVPDSYIKYGTYGASGSVTKSGFYYNSAVGIDTNSIKSLVDLVGFSTEPVRMGELAESKSIKEAIVVVPYTISDDNQRLFLKLNKTEVDNYINKTNTALGSKLSQTTKDQLDKVQDYVLPPHLDFINNSSVQPFALYVFEIEKQLDKTDLSHIWQNVMPPSLDNFQNNTYSISHKLNSNELLSTLNVDENTTIKFMCFKVKQRAITKYQFANYNDVEADNTENSRVISNPKSLLQNAKKLKKATLNFDRTYDKDLIGYNWPYDYCSLVESAKIDATVTFSKFNPNEPTQITEESTPVGQTSNNPTDLFGRVQAEGSTISTVSVNTSTVRNTNFE